MILTSSHPVYPSALGQKFAPGFTVVPIQQSGYSWDQAHVNDGWKSRQQIFRQDFSGSARQFEHKLPNSLGSMSVKETARWVEKLSISRGWTEARTYARSFEENDICGSTLSLLKVEGLKNGLGIVKLGHRLEIISAIKKSELTFMNPTITSLYSHTLQRNRTVQRAIGRVDPRIEKLEAFRMHAQEAMKWTGQGPRKPSLPAFRVVNSKRGFRRSNVHNWLGNNQMFNGACTKRREHNHIYAKGKTVSFVSVVPRLPPIWLSPAKVEIDTETSGYVEVQFGPFVSERSRTDFPGARPRKDNFGEVVICLDILSDIISEKRMMN